MPLFFHLLSAAAFSSRNLSEKPARPKETPANAPGCDRPRHRPGSFCLPRRLEAVPMAKREIKHRRKPKSILKLPDLEQSKSAVLNSLTSPNSQRTYDHAIREFIEWYCSEPRLAFNKTVVTRYRISLEQRHYASTTINLRLAAVRRRAYEAADCGLLSADLAAGIRRVKGAKRLGALVQIARSSGLE